MSRRSVEIAARTGHSVRTFVCDSVAVALTLRRLDNLFGEADFFEQVHTEGIVADEVVGWIDLHAEQTG